MKNKDGSIVERDDLIGEFIFKNDDDEEYKQYIRKMRTSERIEESGGRQSLRNFADTLKRVLINSNR